MDARGPLYIHLEQWLTVHQRTINLGLLSRLCPRHRARFRCSPFGAISRHKINGLAVGAQLHQVPSELHWQGCVPRTSSIARHWSAPIHFIRWWQPFPIQHSTSDNATERQCEWLSWTQLLLLSTNNHRLVKINSVISKGDVRNDTFVQRNLCSNPKE